MPKARRKTTKQTLELDAVELAALDVIAESEGLSPNDLIRTLIRDIALLHFTGKSVGYISASCVKPFIKFDEDNDA